MPSQLVTRQSRRDRGSMSVEMTALVFPVTAIMAVLLLGTWQLSAARHDVHTAAAAAARAASLQASPTLAETAAHQAAETALAHAGRTCHTLTVTLDPSHFTHGGHVDVTVDCQISTGDLIGLNAPGTAATQATARAPIEAHRHLQLPDQP